MSEQEKIRQLLTGYIDNELSEANRCKVEKMLVEQPTLQQDLEAEREMKSLLKNRCTPMKCPEYLNMRIKRKISREKKSSLFEFIGTMFEYRPVAAAVTFATISTLIFLSGYQFLSTNIDFPFIKQRGMSKGVIIGQIICVDCDVFFRTGMEGTHNTEVHRLGLKARNGSVWTIMSGNGGDRSFTLNHNLLEKEARLTGYIFQDSHYILANDYELL